MGHRETEPRTFLKILIHAGVLLLVVILGILSVTSVNLVQAQINAEAATETPTKPFQNALTRMAAPTATEGPTLAVTATSKVPTTEVTTTPPVLSASDALGTITSQQVQIKALQDQLVSKQGDNGATLYAVVIIAFGIILAFAVFFGLKRG